MAGMINRFASLKTSIQSTIKAARAYCSCRPLPSGDRTVLLTPSVQLYSDFKRWAVETANTGDPKGELTLHLTSAESWACNISERKGKQPSLALRLAALAHDIDRAFPSRRINPADFPKEQYECYKAVHALQSAAIAGEQLGKMGASLELLQTVTALIVDHETGGEGEKGVLTDADSMTYFELHLDRYLELFGREDALGKDRFMYSRMSKEAKELARETVKGSPESLALFEQAVKEDLFR